MSEDVDYNRLAKLTDNYSGSDLRELCRNAAIYRIRDYLGAENCSQAIGCVFYLYGVITW